jgi:hypothetical protein
MQVKLRKVGERCWTAFDGRYQVVGREDSVAPYQVTGVTEDAERRSGCHVASLAEAREAIESSARLHRLAGHLTGPRSSAGGLSRGHRHRG